MSSKDGRLLKNVSIGAMVQIILKEDQKSGHLTKGVVESILTNTADHPHGIKVRLKSGKVGRIRKMLSSKKVKNPVNSSGSKAFVPDRLR
jgi:uncharacterized repeat protein (TIGR03833 family)